MKKADFKIIQLLQRIIDGGAGSGGIASTTKLLKGDGAGAAVSADVDVSIDGTFAANSDALVPTAKAVKTYADTKQSAITFGTGVQSALGVNIGSAGAPVLFNGELGTPSSGTATNLTGIPAANLSGTIANAVQDNITRLGTVATGTIGSGATVSDAATFSHDLTAVPNSTGGWTEYFVTGSDFTTSSGAAALETITGLTSGTLSNSTKYEVQVQGQFTWVDSGSAGTKWAFTAGGGGSAAVLTGTITGPGASATASASNHMAAIDTANNNAMGTYNTSNLADIQFRGFITTRSTGTATISFQVSKQTGNGSTITATVKVGTVMRIRKAHT